MSQPLQAFFVSGLDPTGFTQITAAQLLTMIDGATPAPDKGVLIVTVAAAPNATYPNGVPNVPDAIGTPEWQNCMWISVYNNFVTAYIWNPNGATDPTFQNWITISSASIGAGSIQGYQIAVGTITDTNIANVSSAKITGSVVAGWLAQLNLAQTAYATNGLVNNNSPVFGDLAGAGSTITQPVIAPLAVTKGKIALQAVAGNPVAGAAQIQDGSIFSIQIKPNAALATIPISVAAIGGVDLQTNITTPIKSIAGLPSPTNFNPSTVGVAVSPGDVVVVNYDGAGNLDGFVTNKRAVLTLADPTSQTYQQLLGVAPNQTAYSLINQSTFQGANGGNPLGRLLQQATYSTTAVQTTASTLGLTGTAPTTSNTVLITGFGTAGAITVTPLSTTSNIVVEVTLQISNTNAANVMAFLFNGTTIKAGGAEAVNSGNSISSLVFNYSFVAGALTPIVFGIYFVGSNNTTAINGTGGGTALFGGAGIANSFVKITEYI